jgi:hypothetical protein
VNESPYQTGNYASKFAVQNDTFALSISADSLGLELARNGRTVYRLDLDQFIKVMNDSCRKNHTEPNTVPSRFMQQSFEDSTLSLKFEFTGLYGYPRNKIYKTTSTSGTCLLRIKKVPAQ